MKFNLNNKIGFFFENSFFIKDGEEISDNGLGPWNNSASTIKAGSTTLVLEANSLYDGSYFTKIIATDEVNFGKVGYTSQYGLFIPSIASSAKLSGKKFHFEKQDNEDEYSFLDSLLSSFNAKLTELDEADYFVCRLTDSYYRYKTNIFKNKDTRVLLERDFYHRFFNVNSRFQHHNSKLDNLGFCIRETNGNVGTIKGEKVSIPFGELCTLSNEHKNRILLCEDNFRGPTQWILLEDHTSIFKIPETIYEKLEDKNFYLDFEDNRLSRQKKKIYKNLIELACGYCLDSLSPKIDFVISDKSSKQKNQTVINTKEFLEMLDLKPEQVWGK